MSWAALASRCATVEVRMSSYEIFKMFVDGSGSNDFFGFADVWGGVSRCVDWPKKREKIQQGSVVLSRRRQRKRITWIINLDVPSRSGTIGPSFRHATNAFRQENAR